MEYRQIGAHFAELSATLLAIDRDELKKAIETLSKVKRSRACVWIVGNGGSAATASHFANDLTKMAGMKAFSIPQMVPTVTAYGNDHGWEKMFQLVIDRYVDAMDAVVAISCSGRSQNVVQAARGIENLIVLTGNNFIENDLVKLRAKSILSVENDDITIQEDAHLAICHAIAKGLVD